MASGLLPGGAGGGMSSDDVTASKAQVLEGFTALTSDSNDDVAVGTLPKSSVLANKGGTLALDDVLSTAGGTLALSGSAVANHVYEGDTFYKDDAKLKLTGTLQIASLTSFSIAAVVGKMVTFKWDVPDNGSPYSGVIIRYSTTDYPTLTTGIHLYKGYGSSEVAGSKSTYVCEFDEETTYYVSAWLYVTSPTLGQNYSEETGVWINQNPIQITVSTEKTLILYEITRGNNPGRYTVPENATADVYLIGGGGCGGACYVAYSTTGDDGCFTCHAGGGGGSGYVTKLENLSANDTISNMSIGIGGSSSSGDGGSTTCKLNGVSKSASGGKNGGTNAGGAGGTSGGYGGWCDNYRSNFWSCYGGNGSPALVLNGKQYAVSGSGGNGYYSGSGFVRGGDASTYGGGGGGTGFAGNTKRYSGSSQALGGSGADGVIIIVLTLPKQLQFDSSTTFTIPDKVTKIRYCVVAGGKPGNSGRASCGVYDALGEGGAGGNGGEVKIDELTIDSSKSLIITVGASGNDSSLTYNGSTITSISGNGGRGAGGGRGYSHGSSGNYNGSNGGDGTEFNGVFYGAGGNGGYGSGSDGYYSGWSTYGSGGAGGKTQGAAGCGGAGGYGDAFNGRYLYGNNDRNYARSSAGSAGQPGAVIIEFLEVEA